MQPKKPERRSGRLGSRRAKSQVKPRKDRYSPVPASASGSGCSLLITLPAIFIIWSIWSMIDGKKSGIIEPVYNERIYEELKRAWLSLDEGKVAYEPNREMTQGVPEEVRIRVSDDASVPLDLGIFREPAVVEQLKTSGSMSADLTAGKDDFEITRLSSSRQALVGPFTDWIWRVTPLKAGEHQLFLKVTAQIRLSNGDEEVRDVLAKDTVITVAANPSWAARGFFARNWQWLVGGPVTLAVVGGLIAYMRGVFSRRRRKDKPPIGFLGP